MLCRRRVFVSRDDILTCVMMQNIQKDAILRQMKEYKRQRSDFEKQYLELQRRSEYHDDHLRAIDAWFTQLLDEIRVHAAETLPTPPPSAESGMPPPALPTIVT